VPKANQCCRTIFYFTLTKRLIFCLITLIVSIAVLDGTFESSTLTSVDAVFAVGISGPVSYLPLRWKKEWLKRPVFRRCDGDVNSPLPYRTLHDYMDRQSLDMGCEKPIRPKDWRRNVGNTVSGLASDAVRDQIMRHKNHSNVFQDAYLSAHVKLDVQSAVLGEPPHTAVLNMMSHVGPSRDPRASSDMAPDDVWALLPPNAEIEALEQERTRLRGGQYRIKGTEHEGAVKRLTALISTRRAAWRRQVLELYRLYYFENRGNWDLERQAHSEAPVKDNKPPRDLQLPERAALARLLCDQPDDFSPEGLHQRRIEVGRNMVRLGRLQERVRAEVQGFLGTLAAVTCQDPSVDDGSNRGASPCPSSSSSSSWPVAHATCYFDASLVAPHAPSPALGDGSTLTHNSTPCFDYDQSQRLATYGSSPSPDPPPVASSRPLQHVASFAPNQPPQHSPYYHPFFQQELALVTNQLTSLLTTRLPNPPVAYAGSNVHISNTFIEGYADAQIPYYFDTYAAPQQLPYTSAQLYPVDRWETTATCVY
jgi:hypothetical protein